MAVLHREKSDLDPRKTWRPIASTIKMLVLCLGGLAETPARAETERPVVDLELILAVDVSSSMSEAEQRVQRNGYVSAFRHHDVTHATQSGPRGKIAVVYVEWAGPSYQRVVIPWTVIDSYEDAKRFADTLANEPIMSEAGTSISAGLMRAEDLFSRSRSMGERRVIDVSGDGPNNAGLPVALVRDRLVGSGITINGLPISLRRGDPNGFESFGEDYLDSYFEDCVIGGPDSFVMGVDDITQFEVAIRKKLIREIAGVPAQAWPATYRPRSRTIVDCLAIGQAPGR